MEIVEKGPLKVVGIEVVASWRDLWTEAPRAWEQLRARAGEIRNRTGEVFLDVSLEQNEGIYRQVVGAEVNSLEVVPAGMVGVEIPAHRYIRYRHQGTLEEIAESFGRIYEWASENGHEADSFKLDEGYTLTGDEREHDLYVRIGSATGEEGPL